MPLPIELEAKIHNRVFAVAHCQAPHRVRFPAHTSRNNLLLILPKVRKCRGWGKAGKLNGRIWTITLPRPLYGGEGKKFPHVRRPLIPTLLNPHGRTTKKEIEHLIAGWQNQVAGDLQFEKPPSGKAAKAKTGCQQAKVLRQVPRFNQQEPNLERRIWLRHGRSRRPARIE